MDTSMVTDTKEPTAQESRELDEMDNVMDLKDALLKYFMKHINKNVSKSNHLNVHALPMASLSRFGCFNFSMSVMTSSLRPYPRHRANIKFCNFK